MGLQSLHRRPLGVTAGRLCLKTESGGKSLNCRIRKCLIHDCAWFFMLITVVIEFCSYVKVGDFWSLSVRDLCGFLALGT